MFPGAVIFADVVFSKDTCFQTKALLLETYCGKEVKYVGANQNREKQKHLQHFKTTRTNIVNQNSLDSELSK